MRQVNHTELYLSYPYPSTQEQSNPESSDNTGSGGGSQRQQKSESVPVVGGDGRASYNSGGGTAKPYAQTTAKVVVAAAGNSKGDIVENSDWEGPCLKNQAKDSPSAAVATGSGGVGVKGARKSLASGSGRSGGPIGEEAALDNIPTDMSDTTDSEDDKNLE